MLLYSAKSHIPAGDKKKSTCPVVFIMTKQVQLLTEISHDSVSMLSYYG